MELNYYLNLANIPEPLIFGKVVYGAASSLDFAANLNSNTYEYDGLDEIVPDYTIFLTFEKRRHHSQYIFGNFGNGAGVYSGISVGINNTNEVFIDYPRKNISKVFNIRMGNKNCLALKKSGNVFTLYKYDIISGVIEASDSIYLEESDLDNLSENTFTLGGSFSYIALPQNNSSINFFSGFIEQFVMVKASLDESLINIVFKGFRPETLTPSFSTSFTRSESYRWIAPAMETYKTYLSDGFRSIDQYLFTGFSDIGRYISIESGSFGYLTNFDIGSSYYTGDFCDVGGAIHPGGASGYISAIPFGVPSYDYSGWVNINKLSGRMVISRRVSLSIGGTEYRFDYDSAYYDTRTTTGYSSSFDASYYSGLKMDGVFSHKTSLSYLFSGQLKEPTGYHRRAEYDFVRSSFYIPDYSPVGSFYLNGQPEIYGVISGRYIYITGGLSTDVLIYDNTSDYSPLAIGEKNYLSGRYYQNSSRVLDSIDYSNLLLNVDYKETSTGHMYHNVLSQPSGAQLIFTF